MPEARAADGCRIFYEVRGRGRPVLLIPGLGGSGAFWSGVTEHLAREFLTVAIDHRGAGRSDRPPGTYSIEQIAADAAAVLDHAGIGRADVVGHSTGGVVAQVLALEHASRVQSLVISGSWARFDARLALLFEARAEILQKAGPETYQRLTHALGYPAEWAVEHGTELQAAVTGAQSVLSPITVTLERIRMLPRSDLSTELHRIRAPALVIGAPDDGMIPFYQSEQLAAAIPGARLERMTGSHFFPRVHPGQYGGLIRGFLAGLPHA